MHLRRFDFALTEDRNNCLTRLYWCRCTSSVVLLSGCCDKVLPTATILLTSPAHHKLSTLIQDCRWKMPLRHLTQHQSKSRMRTPTLQSRKVMARFGKRLHLCLCLSLVPLTCIFNLCLSLVLYASQCSGPQHPPACAAICIQEAQGASCTEAGTARQNGGTAV